MAVLKTQKNNASVAEYIAAIESSSRRADCERLAAIMTEVTGEQPAMWGTSIVGFGSYHYVYSSGREADWMLTGFSSRKTSLTCYIMAGFEGYSDLMAQLGPHTTGKSCLYLKKLSDVDEKVLRSLIAQSVAFMKTRFGS